MRLDRLKFWLTKNRGLLLVTLLALLVRLRWNLEIHPPLDYAYSDMAAYVARANLLYDKPWTPHPHMTLFPYGTHVLLYGVKLFFGRDSKAAIGVSYAVLGAIAVAFTYATATRFSTRKWVHRITGLILIFYYPWISLGGYLLSEIPFAVGVSASAYFGLRLADKGRPRDAWLAGLAYGLGATVRPQILVSAAFFFLVYLLRRRAFHNVTRGLWVRFAIPLGVILAVSSVRLYWHTSVDWRGGTIGLVSTNGPVNFALGRCHSTSIEAIAADGRGYFTPPSFNALKAYVEKYPTSIIRLDPPLGDLTRYAGHIWDAEPTYDAAFRCIKASGYWKQVEFAITHVALLWAYNFIWPDQNQPPEFRIPMYRWCAAHTVFLLPPLALGMLLAFRRRRARSMLMALHVWAVVVIAMVYFGDTRYRAPYDGIIIVLAIEGYATVLRWFAVQIGGLGASPRVAKQRGAP